MWSFNEFIGFVITQIRSLVLPGSLETNCTITDATDVDPGEFVNDQPSSKHFLTHLSQTQRSLLICGSIATVMVFLIGLLQAKLISLYVSEKKHRKLLLVLSGLFPCAASLCLTGMFIPRAATINASLGLFVFIVAITSLIRLCRYLTGGWAQLSAELSHKGHRMSLMNPPFCCIIPCLPRVSATERNLRWLELSICQAPVIRTFVLLTQIVAIAEYREGATILLQLCDLASLFSLLLLVFAFHTLSRAAGDSLSKYGYSALFRIVDFGLLFFSAQEPLIFENIFVRFGAIGCSSTLSPHDQARFICNFVIIVELFLLSAVASILLRPSRSYLFDEHPRHQYLTACPIAESQYGYKILVYNPRFGASHVSFMGKIADTLADAGHDVVVYQPILERTLTKNGSSNPNIRFFFCKYNGDGPGMLERQDDIWGDDTFEKLVDMTTKLHNYKKLYCDFVLADSKNHELLKKEEFDIAIAEIFESCGFGVLEVLGIKKYVATHSASMVPVINSYLGIPQSLSSVPSVISSNTEKMGFLQRTGNFVWTLFEHYVMDKIMIKGVREAANQAFPGMDIDQKIKDAAFLFVNSDELIDFVSPITSKVIYMGALGRTIPSKPLEKKYLDIFNSAKRGVIYFSFGTVVQGQGMPPHLRQIFLEAFSEFPDINFIWKYESESDNIAKDYKNVFTFPFLPQNDLLDHPKLLAFITHGGMNSITESAIKGAPVIAIPMFGDQNHNAKILEAKGTGIIILKHKITKELLVSAIRKIVSDESYKKNAKQLSRMVKAKPMSAEERVVKYTEFAAEFGDTGVLQSEGKNLHWIQLYSIDSEMPSLEKLDPIHLTKNSDDLNRMESMTVFETSIASSAETIISSKKFSLRQWGIVGILAGANLLSTTTFSCISPFFPGEAQKKNLSTTEIGIIFGVFEFVSLIASPLLGKYLHPFDFRKVFSFSLFFTGITTIAFGFLNLLSNGRLFFWMGFGIRCVEALGDSACLVSAFVLAARCFPEKIVMVVGIMETFAGMGFAVGPVLGGALYEYGGFRLPFFVLGALLILAAVLSFFLIEGFNEDTDQSDDGKGILGMLKIPAIWITVFAVILSAISLDFLDPTLADHLSTFKFSTTLVGLMFLVCQSTYTISALVFGILIDRWQCSNTVMIFGSATMVISMLLIGPSPFLDFGKHLILIILSLAILGVAAQSLYIPTYKNCLDAVKKHGYEDGSRTYGYVSGIIQSAFAFGSFIGPTAGSFGVEIIGFGWTTTVIAFINAIFMLILVVSLITRLRIHSEPL